jgi:hypothetical protein
MFEDMQLEDCMRLSGLTCLTLRNVGKGNHGTLVAVLPRLTTLRSLTLVQVVLYTPGLPAAGRLHLWVAACSIESVQKHCL